MRTTIVTTVLITFCFAVTAAAISPRSARHTRQVKRNAAAKQASAKHVETLDPEAVFKTFKALDEVRELVPPVFGGPSSAPNLDVANCFGLKLPNGTKVMAESSGRDYGLTFGYAGEAQKTAIGLLRVDGPVVLENKQLSPASYIVFVSPESVSLMTSSVADGTYSHSLPLTSKLDAESLRPKALQRLRFTLEVDGAKAFLRIGENRFGILGSSSF